MNLEKLKEIRNEFYETILRWKNGEGDVGPEEMSDAVDHYHEMLEDAAPELIRMAEAGQKLREDVWPLDCECHGKQPWVCARCKAIDAYDRSTKEVS